ncbi:hypothetical protein GA0061081_1041, partial [Gilliamella bombicola]
NVKYGALPSISFDVFAVNAIEHCAYDNKSSNTKNNGNLGNLNNLSKSGKLDRKDKCLGLGDNPADKHGDFTKCNDFDNLGDKNKN